MTTRESFFELSWKVPHHSYLVSRKNRAILKAKFRTGVLAARYRNASLGIVGAYNTSNIGDLAMGWTVQRIADNLGAKSELQSIGGLDTYPVRNRSILGGGGLINAHEANSTLQQLLRYPPDRLAIVGVDAYINSDECSEQVRSMLQRVAWIGVRNEASREALEAITGRTDIQVSPDIAFALASTIDARGTIDAEREHRPILGVNVVPNLISIHGRQARAGSQPSAWFQKHLPEEANVYCEIGQRYVDLLRRVVEIYRSRGWRVRHIPFAVEDDTLARTVLANTGVEFVPYRANPSTVLDRVSGCTRMIASRFHAHVFALLSGTPVLSVAYALKCSALWEEHDLDRSAQVHNLELVRNPDRAVEALTNAEPVGLIAPLHRQVQLDARVAVEQALAALQVD